MNEIKYRARALFWPNANITQSAFDVDRHDNRQLGYVINSVIHLNHFNVY